MAYNIPRRNRIAELTKELHRHQLTVEQLTHWLVENPEHPARVQYRTDKAYHERQVQLVKAKIANLHQGQPENGYGDEQPTFNQNQHK